MLSESSYHTAIYIYVGSASIMLLYLAWWLSRHWRAGFVALVVLPLAALLLTPAYPKAGVETMAPALIVAVFQFATQGPDAAAHAIRPLVFMSGVAVVVAVLMVVVSFLRGRRAKPQRPPKPAAQRPASQRTQRPPNPGTRPAKPGTVRR
jgi:thiol:disulfide interchange protein